MARLELFVVSQSVSVDNSTNFLSVFEILDDLFVKNFPTTLSHCVAIAVWRPEAGDEDKDFQARLRITTPSGDTSDIHSNMRITSARHRLIQKIEGIPLTEVGTLRFEMALNEELVAEKAVDIHHSGPLDTTGSSVTAA